MRHCTTAIKAYVAAGHNTLRSLPLSVTSQQRKQLHGLCTQLGLWHGSKLDAVSGLRRFQFAQRRAFLPSTAADGAKAMGRLVILGAPSLGGGATVPTRGVITSYCAAVLPAAPSWRVDFEGGHSASFEIEAIRAGEVQRWEEDRPEPAVSSASSSSSSSSSSLPDFLSHARDETFLEQLLAGVNEKWHEHADACTPYDMRHFLANCMSMCRSGPDCVA